MGNLAKFYSLRSRLRPLAARSLRSRWSLVVASFYTIWSSENGSLLHIPGKFARYIVLLVLIWLAGFVLFVSCIPYSAVNEIADSDAIVVLTGGKLRVPEGLKLLAGGLAPRLFISGVGTEVKLPELLVANGVALEEAKNVSEDKIVLGRSATTTTGNALETAEWVRLENIKSIILVTANYHMPRSLVELQAAMPNVKITAHPVFPDPEKFTDWWGSIDTIFFLTNEYNKYILAVVLVRL